MTRKLLLASFAFSPILQAATYQWTGTTSSDWTTATNWTAVGVGATGVSAAHRLNVNNNAANPAIYTSAQGTTTYAGGSAARGVAIGSGTLGAGRLFISGGTFSTVGSGAADVIGNVVGATLPSGLTVNGGNFIGNSGGMVVNFGGTNNVCDITVESGSATFSLLTLGNSATGSAKLNLLGGVTSVNSINRANGPGTVIFGGGVLKARLATTAFMQGLTAAVITAAGGTIDTGGVNVTMNQPLVDDTTSVGGSFTKTGAGVLTAPGAHTYTGPTSVAQGKLVVTAPLASPNVTVAAGAALQLKAGLTTWMPSQVTLAGNLEIDLGLYKAANPVPLAASTLQLDGPVTLSVSGNDLTVGTITLLTYTAKTGPGSFTLGTLPPGAAGTLVDTGSAIELHLTSPSVLDLTWSSAGGTWQLDGANLWNDNSIAYREYGSAGDLVTFTDTAAGSVDLMGDVRPITMTVQNTIPYTFQGSGKIAGGTNLVKNGTGVAKFLTADSFTGTTAVNAGTILIATANTTTGPVTVENFATFGLQGVTDGAGQTLTYVGPGNNVVGGIFPSSFVQRGALQGVTGNNVWEGTVRFSGTNARIGVQDGATLTITGNILENAPTSSLIVRAGSVGSDVTLSGTGNNWTGNTDVFSTGGSIKAGAANVIPSVSLLRIGTTGVSGTSVFDMNGFNQTITGLATQGGLSQVTNTGTAPATLTLRPIFTAPSFPGIITDGTSKISLVKEGSNTQTLTGINTYTGNTTVAEGSLAITQPYLANAADVSIGANGTLALNFVGSDVVNALTINGVAKSPGDWGSTASGAANVDQQLIGTGILSVTTGPTASPYDSWAAAAGLTGQAGAATADPDGDGLQNLLEFALGSSPTTGSAAQPTTQPSTGNLVVSFSRSDASEGAATLSFQVSDDLSNWPAGSEFAIPATTDTSGTLPGGATVTVTENGADADTVVVTLPNGATGRKFARLKATQP
jgi:autotransporter-associated beta strand protein